MWKHNKSLLLDIYTLNVMLIIKIRATKTVFCNFSAKYWATNT